MTAMRGLLAALVAIVLAAAAWIAWFNTRDVPDDPPAIAARTATLAPALVARGEYLARAGNCLGCHTEPGEPRYAGGRAIETPFGTVFSPNITSDASTGLGTWTARDFWRAMHLGRSKDGHLLSPAFPYTNFTRVTREDSDAIYAYLRSLPPVQRADRASGLRYPYGTRWALAAWRALYFRPGEYEQDGARSAAWNRGAYLVEGLGHCAACHSPRNALGGIANEDMLRGGRLPVQHWYAPSLAGLAGPRPRAYSTADIAAALKDGVSARGTTLGPMAEVVFESTQHLQDADVQAMAEYLATVAPHREEKSGGRPMDPETLALGKRLYEGRCIDCHGRNGEGVAGKYPPLVGNLTVSLPSPANLANSILLGGFAPVTAGDPWPYGMPPFGQQMNDREVAAVASYVRATWGGDPAGVSELEVQRER
jgi:mono/diheme cytochrome c family protein